MEHETAWELIKLGDSEYGVRNTSGEPARYVSVRSNLDVAHHKTDGTQIAPGEVFAFSIDSQEDIESVWVCISWLSPQGDGEELEAALTTASTPVIKQYTINGLPAAS